MSLLLSGGEILALLGENGAGQCTVIKMLAGIHVPDFGRILFRDEPYTHLRATKYARQSVAFIQQDLGLIDWMMAENIAPGVGYARRRSGHPALTGQRAGSGRGRRCVTCRCWRAHSG